MDDGNPLTSLAATGSVASRFVTQTEIDSAKERRDEQWKAAYARLGQEPPPRPTEDPEYDGRSLYERLQANKTAKQEQWEEKNKLSNQFRALEEDEIHFLDGLIDEKIIKERKRKEEENEELKGFREAVLQREAEESAANAPAPPTSAPKPPPPKATAPAPAKTQAKKNQKALLKGAIVRKPSAPASGSTKSTPKPASPVKPAPEGSTSTPKSVGPTDKPSTPPTDEAPSGKKRSEPSVTETSEEANKETQSTKRQKV